MGLAGCRQPRFPSKDQQELPVRKRLNIAEKRGFVNRKPSVHAEGFRIPGLGVCLHVPLDSFRDGILHAVKIMMHLQIQPELRSGAEIAGETQGSVGGNGTGAVNDLIDPPCRNRDVLRKTVLGQLVWA